MRKRRLKLLAFMMLAPLVSIVIGTASPIVVDAAVQATYYVDPVNGNDNNNGTSTGTAFKTITKARDVVRTVNSNMTGDIMVYLRGGTYFLTDTVVFNATDSGTNGYYVKYINYPGEIPLISGGEVIGGWTLHDAAKNIYKANVGSRDFRQFYVDGVRAVRARSNLYNDFYYDKVNQKIRIAKSEMTGLTNFSNAELVNYFTWADAYYHIASYTTDSTYCYIELPGLDKTFAFNQAQWRSDCNYKYYIENDYSLLDTDGEWYLDKSVPGSHVLYYKPRPGESFSSEIIAPKLENLFYLQGSLNSKVHNMVFYGLTFAYSNWTLPNTYGCDLQMGQQVTVMNETTLACKRPPGAVQTEATRDVVFERNTFKNLGAVGLNSFYGSERNIIKGNVFTNIASSGIQLGRFQPDEMNTFGIYNPADLNDLSRDDVISNNYFVDTCNLYFGAVPLSTGYAVNTKIEHNEINGAPYSGIHTGGHSTDSVSVMKGIVIRFNKITNVMKDLNDGGYIYNKGSNADYWAVYENYLQSTVAPSYPEQNFVGALYTDNGTSYAMYCRNVVDEPTDTLRYNTWGNPPNSFANLMDTNVFHDTNNGNNTNTVVIRDSVITAGPAWPPEIQEIINNAGLEAAYADIKNGGPAPAPVTPALIPAPTGEIPLAGLCLWLKADAGVTKDGGNYVSSWADYSGKGLTAYQLNSSKKPLWVTNAIKGKPTLRFDGADDSITTHDFVSCNMRNFTLSFIIKPSGLSDFNQALGAMNDWGQFYFHGSANGTIYAGPESDSRIVTSSGTLQNNTVQLFTYKYSNGTAVLYKNGVQVATAYSLKTPYAWTGFTLGNIKGDLPEVILYNTTLSDTDRNTVETYLRNKYQ